VQLWSGQNRSRLLPQLQQGVQSSSDRFCWYQLAPNEAVKRPYIPLSHTTIHQTMTGKQDVVKKSCDCSSSDKEALDSQTSKPWALFYE